MIRINFSLKSIILCTFLSWCGTGHFADAATKPLRWSQLAIPVFNHLTTDHGLTNPGVTAIAEDGDGFLWVGTYGGIARWDGYHFRSYRSEPKNANSLADNYVLTLHTDAGGKLWIGTSAGGLAFYDRAHDRIVRIALGREGIGHSRINAIADDGDGGLWVGTDGGLYHLDRNGRVLGHFRHGGAGQSVLPDDRVFSLLRDGAGVLWVGTASGVVRWDGKGFTLLPIAAQNGRVPQIYSMFEDAGGRLWFGARGNGVFLLEQGKEAAYQFVEGGAILNNSWVDSIESNGKDEVWFGTRGHGIVVMNMATRQPRHIRHVAAQPSSLADDAVEALYRDRSGLLWVGTYAGLSQIDPNQVAVQTIFGDTGLKNGLSGRYIASVLAKSDGRVWVGFGSNGGVDILDPDGARVGALRPNSKSPATALPEDAVWALAEAPDGSVWIGTGRGLYRASSDGRHLVRVKPGRRSEVAWVISLLVDGPSLWIGGYEDGLWRVNPETGETLDHFGPNQLIDSHPKVLFNDQQGVLWIGTGNGLDRLEKSTGKIEHIRAGEGDPHLLSGGWVSSLITDGYGRLWVATHGGGIDILEGRDDNGHPRFRRIGTAAGLPDANVDMLLSDQSGRMWASTDHGLASIEAQTFAVHRLGKPEGVAIPTYWTGSGAKTSRGELLFGGSGGLTVVQPDRLIPWNYDPPVVVSALRTDNRLIPAHQGRNSTEQVVLSSPTQSLNVEFSALDYSAPEHNRYAYRLVGFDNHWIETDWTRRIAAYTNLPPGQYELHLRGSNRNGDWTRTNLVLPIVIEPAWYQMLWFRISLVFGAGVVVALLVQIRTAHLRRQHSALEDIVDQRTADLKQANLELERISNTDPLTNLANRRKLDEVFEAEHNRAVRHKRPLSIILTDIDKFKSVNDTHGHQVGDQVLCEMAKILSDGCRRTDIVGRWGGEEFMVICPETELAGAVILAKKLRHSVEIRDFPVIGRKTSSFGVAQLYNGETIASLVARADEALYRAKESGRNRVESSDGTMMAPS